VVVDLAIGVFGVDAEVASVIGAVPNASIVGPFNARRA